MTREQERELFWQRLESFYKIRSGLKKLEQHDAQASRLRSKERRWSNLAIASLTLATVLSFALWGQSIRAEGPSHHDKVKLQRLIDAN